MFKRSGMRIGLGAVVAAVVLLGSVTSAAYAQGRKPPLDSSQPFYKGTPYRGCEMSGELSMWQAGWGMSGYSLVDATAEATGLTVDEVIAALQDGQTFAQIAEAEGIDPQVIVDAFVAERAALLEQAVADGRLTQEQVDLMLEAMAEHLIEQLESSWMRLPEGAAGTWGGRTGGRGMSRGGMRGAMPSSDGTLPGPALGR